MSPAEKCESAKVKSAGQYSACLARETARSIQTGSPPDYAGCASKLAGKFAKAEAAGGAACLTRFDFAVMQNFIATHAAAVAAALAGDGLPPDDAACAAELQTCRADLFACRCGNGIIDVGEDCDGTAPNSCTNGCNATCECITPAGCEATNGGLCWFRGMPGESCATVCANADRSYDAATSTYAGSNGSAANCQAVLTSLGLPTDPFFDIDQCANAVGCAVLPNTLSMRCTAPPTTDDAAPGAALRVCACQ
jgi:hypothetical protein